MPRGARGCANPVASLRSVSAEAHSWRGGKKGN